MQLTHPHNKLSHIFTIIMLMLLANEIGCQSCDVCVDLVAFGCKICYNNCTTDTNQSQFKSCDHTYCSYYTYDSNVTSSCAAYEAVGVFETQCFSQCCQASQNYFSLDTLDKCDKKSQTIMKIVIGISVSIFGIILIVFLFICIKSSGCPSCSCGICECIGGCCQCFGDCLQYIFKCKCCRSDPEPVASNNVSFNQSNSEPLHKWEQESHAIDAISDEESTCAICLSNRVNVLTKCSHYFHIECILQWYNRNPHCPLCLREDVRIVKYYCRGCCLRYVQTDLKFTKNLDLFVQKIKGPNCEVCR